MKKLTGRLRAVAGLWFPAAVLAAALLLDWAAASTGIMAHSPLFGKNDYERLVVESDESMVYDKALYGSSVAIHGYLEEQSDSGYRNIGIVYGTIEDLDAMLNGGYITVESDLVIMYNYLTFLDDMDTDETYPWYRRPLDPYVGFYGNRISVFSKSCVNLLITERSLEKLPRYGFTRRYTNLGTMTPEELSERIAYHAEHYWSRPVSDYTGNLEALQRVIDYCAGNGIRLRALVAPLNPDCEIGENPKLVMEQVNTILAENGIEIYDVSDEMTPADFYDLGHLNYAVGAPRFTEMIGAWLKQ